MDSKDYSKYFSEKGFFMLLRGSARKVKFIREALALFCCYEDSSTPQCIKSMIIAALGYFIMPLDAIADIIPIVGWADDAGVVAATLEGIRSYVKPEHYRQADEFLGKPIDGTV